MSIIKETDEHGLVCVLRFEGKNDLSCSDLAEIFKAVAKDYPEMKSSDVGVYKNSVSFYARPKADYKKNVNL